MIILEQKIGCGDLEHIEQETFFSDICMMKAVADIEKNCLH